MTKKNYSESTQNDNDVSIIENTFEAKNSYHSAWWGGEDIELNSDQIEALLKGECLAFNDGEYSHTIHLARHIVGQLGWLSEK